MARRRRSKKNSPANALSEMAKKIEKLEDLKIEMKLPNPLAGLSFEFELVMPQKAVEAKVKKAYKQALSDIRLEFETALISAMKVNWSWRNGSRDIIDTGALADSGDVKVNGYGYSVSYSSPYANLVHYGGYIQPYGNQNAESVYLPARPWVRGVLEGAGPVRAFDWEGSLNRAMGRQGNA